MVRKERRGCCGRPTVTIYHCDNCDNVFPTNELAEKCELSHTEPELITEAILPGLREGQLEKVIA